MIQNKRDIDIVAVIKKYLPLRPLGSSKLSSPCPFCLVGSLAGVDRFSVKPDRHIWNCNKCTPGKWHDVITFVQLIEGVGYYDACLLLNLDPYREKTEHEPFFGKLYEVEPDIVWVRYGWERIYEAQANLWSAPKPLAWLKERRGLTEESIIKYKLGFFDQEQLMGESLPIPIARGIVIPQIAVDGTLWGIKIASGLKKSTPTTKKYIFVQGSQPALIGKVSNKAPLLVVEGDFDVLLGMQEVADLIDIVTLGSSTAKCPPRWLQYINYHNPIIPLYDNDAVGLNGAMKMWKFMGDRVLNPIPQLPQGKDISDFIVEYKGDFHSWIEDILLKAIPPINCVAPPIDYIIPSHVQASEHTIGYIELEDTIIEELNKYPASLVSLIEMFKDYGQDIKALYDDLKDRGYLLVDKQGIIYINPVFKRHEPFTFSTLVKKMTIKPYWFCPCGVINWASSDDGKWKCFTCDAPANEPVTWGTTRDYLRQAKRPVFGQPIVK